MSKVVPSQYETDMARLGLRPSDQRPDNVGPPEDYEEHSKTKRPAATQPAAKASDKKDQPHPEKSPENTRSMSADQRQPYRTRAMDKEGSSQQ